MVADTAHNQEGLNFTLKQIEETKFEKLHLVLGMVADKNLEHILPLFPRNATYYFCQPNIPRALDSVSLKEAALAFGLE